MNIHIIPNEKFTQNYIKFMNEMFPINENHFYVYHCGTVFPLSSYDNMTEIVSIKKEVDLSLLKKKTDKLFIHGFYASEVIKYLYFERNKIDFHKVVLIIWGADLYNNQEFLKTPGLHIKAHIKEYMKKQFVRRTRMYMTFASPDFDLICQLFGTTGKQFDCLYPSSIDKEYLDYIMGMKRNSEKLRVMLGNSATRSNQHIQALNWLRQYYDEKFEIICPLSYGDMEYAKEVEAYGIKYYGERFIPVKNYLKPQEYADLLNSVDVAVFNNNRQQATANIEILSYLGKKIYMRSDTTTWKHYVLRDKCVFFDTLEIVNMDFKNFQTYTENDKQRNRQYFSNIWNPNYIKKLWDGILKYEIY